MTMLAVLSDALAAVDRRLEALRRSNGNGFAPLVVPVAHDGPLELSGENRVVSYADSVATYPVIFAVWSKLLRHLATTDFGVYRMGDDRALERVHGTDLEELLREPAPGKGLFDLLQWLYNPYLVEGNSLVAKFRGNGPGTTPTNLLPLDWRYMTALARPGGPVEYWVSYQIGDPRVLDPGELVHMAWHSPDGSTIGPSPLRALGTAIRLDDAAQRFQRASLDNAARPAGALVFPKDAQLTDDERTEMREKVERQHRGVDEAFRLAVLYGGVEWKQMSFSAAEAELISTRNISHNEVCIAYDVRRSVIADSETATGRAMTEVLRDFHRSLRPHVSLAEGVLQRQLIDPEPAWRDERYVVRFDLSDLLRGTYREEVETAVLAYVNGVAALDEVRPPLALTPLNTDDSRTPHVPHAQLQPGRDGRSLPPSNEPNRERENPPAPTS